MQLKPQPFGTGRARQRGLSIVELMVGVAIGLIIVAAAAVMMSSQLVENRRLMVEAQLQQDLRAAADIISRDIRRSGYLTQKPLDVPSSLDTLDSYAALVSTSNTTLPTAVSNPLQAQFARPSSSSVQFEYRYTESGSADQRQSIYRLNGGVLESRLANTYQALTDGNVMEVTSFQVDPPVVLSSQRLPCPKLCSGGTTNCWPTLEVRAVSFTISARGRGVNQNITRQVKSTVRLRNDNVRFNHTVLGLPVICPP